MAVLQAGVLFTDSKGCCQKCVQQGVGFAVHRRRGEANLDPLTVQPGERVRAGFGLQWQ